MIGSESRKSSRRRRSSAPFVRQFTYYETQRTLTESGGRLCLFFALALRFVSFLQILLKVFAHRSGEYEGLQLILRFSDVFLLRLLLAGEVRDLFFTFATKRVE